jgi:hypothetical protein
VAFIRRKQVNGTTYYSLVESVRENGRVRQRVIVSVGQCATIDEAIEVETNELAFWQHYAKWGREHRTNGRWVFVGEGSEVRVRVGEPAQLRADKCEKRLQLLRQYFDVVAKSAH